MLAIVPLAVWLLASVAARAAAQATSPGVAPGPLGLAPAVPRRRLTVMIGKFGTVDFFDVNSAGGDSHLQFLNWTVDNNGAYDYAADTRGYTIGALIEYQERSDVLAGQPGALRLLAYTNHSDMGSYREAIDAFLSGRDSNPDITAHRRPGRTKSGLGLNLEQSLGHRVEVFGRAGVNDGKNESFAYTEADRSREGGAAWVGPPWRCEDRLGIAVVSNGLSDDHRQYLAIGGRGFLLGDGRLSYGSEEIVEAYYTCAVGLALSVAFDVQHIAHPGYNRDRGPVNVFALRAHLDFPAGGS